MAGNATKRGHKRPLISRDLVHTAPISRHNCKSGEPLSEQQTLVYNFHVGAVSNDYKNAAVTVIISLLLTILVYGDFSISFPVDRVLHPDCLYFYSVHSVSISVLDSLELEIFWKYGLPTNNCASIIIQKNWHLRPTKCFPTDMSYALHDWSSFTNFSRLIL